ncbi:hypothetical protein, unlikely [Trypanosoma brucei brucei TREU927]|uniref:Uncharacterized protein n=1 Tax=Trypanosoma brucei brucei (strain 927/4 GUTat10.1) TaxID=185431 RepID=Q38DN3_TRYB2|nr:hypothetical protein, unlikely [Trypanosoma brucei brucei TREU927]EAN77087.1 hypothetical protein, unlikely [Trypanosoma brucei brucei TREU927]
MGSGEGIACNAKRFFSRPSFGGVNSGCVCVCTISRTHTHTHTHRHLFLCTFLVSTRGERCRFSFVPFPLMYFLHLFMYLQVIRISYHFFFSFPTRCIAERSRSISPHLQPQEFSLTSLNILWVSRRLPS